MRGSGLGLKARAKVKARVRVRVGLAVVQEGHEVHLGAQDPHLRGRGRWPQGGKAKTKEASGGSQCHARGTSVGVG